MKKITVHQDQSYKKLGDLFGLFFEDLNHAADGGLYAELVQNRSFEFCEIDRKEYHALTAWNKKPETEWEVRTEKPLHEENTQYLHVNAKTGDYIYNTGFNTGIFLETGKKYDFSMWARVEEKPVEVNVSVRDEQGRILTEGILTVCGNEW